jgi:type IV pilus assembly protein PilM
MFSISTNMRPIGVDIGHHSIKMLQLGGGSSLSVIAAAKREIGAAEGEARQEAIVQAIKEMLSDAGFRGNQVVTCLASEQLKIKSVRIDNTADDALEELIRTDIASRFGLDPEREAIKYMTAGSVQQGDDIRKELLIFAADNESINSHIELIESTGLRLDGIDAMPCALFRSFERQLRREEDRDIVHVYVDIGSTCTTVVVGRGKDISFVKQISIGGERFNNDIASRLGIDNSSAALLRRNLNDASAGGSMEPATKEAVLAAMQASAEQLGREIALCFRYFSVTFRGARPARAVFTGGEACETTLMSALQRQLGIEVEIAEPMRGFDISALGEAAGGKTCEWAVAVGLSLKGWNTQQGAYEGN